MKRFGVLLSGIAVGGLLFVAGYKMAAAQDTVQVNAKFIKVKVDNSRVRVFESVLQPGDKEEMHSHPAYVTYVVAGGKIRTTITGFYNDYKDFQVIIGYPTFPTFGIELNVPNKTKIYGFEGDIEFHSGGFSFDAGINVMHSELGQFYAVDTRNPPANPLARHAFHP